MSQWYYQAEHEALGPLSFQDLAVLFSDGVLVPASLVREGLSGPWKRLDDVPGLITAARKLKPAQSPARPVGDPASQPRKSPRLPPVEAAPESRPWGRYAALTLVLMVLALEAWWWWPRTPAKFPAAEAVTLKFDIPARIAQMLPPSQTHPRQPLTPVGPPEPVPGLEKLGWMKNPWMTPDRLAIVYVGFGGPDQLDDLFLSERLSVDERFPPAKKIEACSGTRREIFPTLSADGLLLVYAEDAGPYRLMSSRRTKRGEPFPTAEPLNVEGLDPELRMLDAPRLLSADELIFSATTPEFTKREIFLARRTGPASFNQVAAVGLVNGWPRYAFSGNRKRAYFLNEEGLFITMQAPKTGQFVTPEKWLGIEQLGPNLGKFDDSVWIAPDETLILFGSPGLNDPESTNHRLWQLRLE
jgi:hypothetical protein